MSIALINSLISNDSQVCRFCLQINTTELDVIYEQIPEKTSIGSINTTVWSVLTLLGIQVSLNDAYPNLICRRCRELLHSIHHFRETALSSLRFFDKARLLKEFPNVEFRDCPGEENLQKPIVKEYSALEEENVETLEEQSEEVESSVAELAQLVPDDALACSKSGDYIKEEVNTEHEEIAIIEPTEAEWVVYEEVEVHNEVDEVEEDDMEAIYLDEETEQGNELAEETNSVKVENVQLEIETEKIQKPPKPKKHSNALKNCPVCGITSTAMAVHMRTHTNVRPFVCQTCEKGFYTSNKLNAHIQSVHIGERKFPCEICGKSFVMKKTLNTHMMSHLAEKSHVCSLCSKSFLFRWALVKHERTHTGEKPYLCTLDGCGRSFASSSNLRQHQKTAAHHYSTLREARCEHCGKLFQNKYALRTHKKHYHNLQEEASSE